MGELESRIAQGYVKSRLDTMPTARECRKVLKEEGFPQILIFCRKPSSLCCATVGVATTIA